MIDLARQMSAYADDYDADGLLQIIAELETSYYPSLELVRDAFTSLSVKSKNRWDLDPAVVARMDSVIECLDTAVQQARTVVPDIRETERDTIRKLQSPTHGDRIRDVAANERGA